MRLLEVEISTNLAPFSVFIRRQGIDHRIYIDGNVQVLELRDPSQGAKVEAAFNAWQSGDLVLDKHAEVASDVGSAYPAYWRRTTIVVGLLLLVSLVIFLLRQFVPGAALLDNFAFQPPGYLMEGGWQGAQIWRWLTPILVHFSWPHLLFNSVVVWELGCRIEARFGALKFAALVAYLGVLSNSVQFYWSQSIFFGGLSGVAYGFLGFLLSATWKRQDPAWQVPMGFAAGLLIFLVIFSTGVSEIFGLYIANAAHWSGLIAGIVAGSYWRWRKITRNSLRAR